MKLRNLFPASVAVGAGLITLVFFFFRTAEFSGYKLSEGLTVMLNWATTLAAVALLAGIVNLLAVHIRKVSAFSGGWAYSIVLVIFFFIIVGLWFLSWAVRLLLENGFLQPNETLIGLVDLGQTTFNWMFMYVQMPVEATLSAVLAVILILAGARLIRKQRNWTAFVFVAVSLFLILNIAPIGLPSFLSDIRVFVVEFVGTLAVGATRGILLGVALGVVATGLRVIIGVDHPYGD